MMYDGLDDALIKALGSKSNKKAGGPSKKAKPPKGRAVALSTTCQELFMDSGSPLNYA